MRVLRLYDWGPFGEFVCMTLFVWLSHLTSRIQSRSYKTGGLSFSSTLKLCYTKSSTFGSSQISCTSISSRYVKYHPIRLAVRPRKRSWSPSQWITIKIKITYSQKRNIRIRVTGVPAFPRETFTYIQQMPTIHSWFGCFLSAVVVVILWESWFWDYTVSANLI